MTKFRYQARNSEGERLEGIIDAETIDGVASQLIGKGLVPINITSAGIAVNLLGSLKIPFFKSKPTLPELIIFCRQMSVLLKAGVSFIDAVTDLRKIARSDQFKEALDGIVSGISSGMSVAPAVAKYRDIFPPIFISVLESGERAGRLDDAFKELAIYLDFEYRVRKQFKATMRYPIMVLFAVIAAMIVINVFVVPTFSKMLLNFKVPLPLPTKILIATSDFLMTRWWVILFALIIIIALFRMFLKTDKGRLLWDTFILKVPILGKVFYRIALSRFVRSFAVIVQAGIPIVEGLKFIAKATSNAYVRQGVYYISTHIERGESFASAARSSQLFENVALQMISVGETSGQIDVLLYELSEFYNSEVEYDLKRLNELLEPIILVILGGMVLILALAIFMPMWSLVKIGNIGG